MSPIVVSGVILALTLTSRTICVTKQGYYRSFLVQKDLSSIRQYYSDVTQCVKQILCGGMGQ